MLFTSLHFTSSITLLYFTLLYSNLLYSALLYFALLYSTLGTDLLIGGIEASLWIAEQWAADLRTMFPQLNVVTVSANKYCYTFRPTLSPCLSASSLCLSSLLSVA